MKIKMHNLKRTGYVLVALTFVLAGVFPGVVNHHAYAFPSGGQLVDREIRMSSSAIGTVTNGQSVTYLVAFEPATAYTIKGIIVDFCGGASSTTPGTPIINDADCDKPTGFTIGASPSVTTTSVDDDGDATIVDLGDGGGTWVAASAAGTTSGQTLQLTNSTGVALSTGTRYGFTINSVTNPTPAETFYARIITYTSDTEDVTSYTHSAADNGANTNEAKDYGGIALSINSQISITARVRESLTFCVSAANPTANCGGTSAPNLLLNNGTEDIVDTLGPSTAQAYIQASTNAQSGVAVRMRNTATCAGLSRDGGTTCGLAAIGAAGNTLGATVSPNGLFGMYVDDSGGTLDLVADTTYATSGTYAFDDNTTSGILSTYGDIIASSTTTLDSVENILNFGARASSTTPAGLYTATLIVTATGTF